MAGIIYTPPPVTPTPPTPPGGNINSIQYNGGSIFKGLDFLESDAAGEHQQFIAALTTPSTPPADRSILFASNEDGDGELSVLNQYDKSTPLQLGIGHKIVGMIQPGNGSLPLSSFSWFGGANIQSSGNWDSNATAKVATAGVALPNVTRQRCVSNAALNATSETAMTDPKRAAIVGYARQAWGTKLIITFGLPTYRSDQRLLIGYTGNAGLISGAVDPSTLLNSVAIIKDVAQSTFNFYFRGTAGGNTFNSGITPTVNGLYRVTVFVPSTGTQAFINFQEIGVNAITSNLTYFSSNIPAQGVSIFPHLYASTAGVATAVSFALVQIYEEQL
jgi:hypothetical protein